MRELTKNCELVLDEIKKLKPDNNGIYYTNRYVAENANLSMRYDEFLGVLDTLAGNNQIKWGDKQHTAFALIETGRAYKELNALSRREKRIEWLKGLASGLVIWAITELIQWLIRLKT